jgi:hypothetical protein
MAWVLAVTGKTLAPVIGAAGNQDATRFGNPFRWAAMQVSGDIDAIAIAARARLLDPYRLGDLLR